MIFEALPIPGSFLVRVEPHHDTRGFFARTFCEREFAEHGVECRFVQCSISHNPKRGTLRGLHYQEPPYAEAKLVRCTRGAIYDVIVDTRRRDGTPLWCAVELTAENHNALYAPAGVAHGFQSTEDDSEVFYQISQFYHPESARGIRWDDPTLAIPWPILPPIISARDAQYSDLA